MDVEENWHFQFFDGKIFTKTKIFLGKFLDCGWMFKDLHWNIQPSLINENQSWKFAGLIFNYCMTTTVFAKLIIARISIFDQLIILASLQIFFKSSFNIGLKPKLNFQFSTTIDNCEPCHFNQERGTGDWWRWWWRRGWSEVSTYLSVEMWTVPLWHSEECWEEKHHKLVTHQEWTQILTPWSSLSHPTILNKVKHSKSMINFHSSNDLCFCLTLIFTFLQV